MANALSLRVDPKPEAPGELNTETLVFREFGGVNVQSPRQSINDDQFAWLENIMPIAYGNAPVVPAPSATLANITGKTVSYAYEANLNGTDYSITVFTDGSASQVKLTSPFTVTSIAVATTFSASGTRAVQWKNERVLIIDPSKGYFNWNGSILTTPTSLTGLSVTAAGTGYTSQPAVAFSGPGSGAAATAYLKIVTISSIAAGGTNYQVNDILTVTGGTLGAPTGSTAFVATIKVLTLGGGGAVATASINFAGNYSAIPANAVAVSGGSGTGATFNLAWGVDSLDLTNPGTGYTTIPSITFSGGAGSGAAAAATIQAGTLVGTSIAVYAGRVWIGKGRTVSFTDVNSFNSFAGVGGSFTITEPYLHNGVTALFVANNFLYIFGDDSIDALSNVNVSGGVTTFSRVNLTASIGTTLDLSVFAYYRSVLFANPSGFYRLTGATPQKISDELDALVAAIDFTKPVSGGQVFINNIACAAFLFTFNDTFTPAAKSRAMLAVFFNNKWWFASQGDNLSLLLSGGSSQLGGVSVLFAWDTNNLYRLFNDPLGAINTRLQTKLWDAGAPILDKQVLAVGLGIKYTSFGNQTINVTTDNEVTSDAPIPIGQIPSITWVNNSSQIVQWTNISGNVVQWVNTGYILGISQAATGGGKYMGVTATSTFNGFTYALVALQFQSGRPW